MKKSWLTAIAFIITAYSASSQTLFTYGDNKADAKEFLRAFSKNNQQPAANRQKAMKDYLELYINSRLKIREAYARRYDTLPQLKSEVDMLRNEIMEKYMSEPQAIERLTQEAFTRSQKDIHVAHIFISLKDASGMVNEVPAKRSLDQVMSLLPKEPFETVAQQLSDDTLARHNKGDLGYITVFTLPYEFENIIYSTPVGSYSKPYASKAGYHIFKNLGERKAIGKVKIQQILLAFPPGADMATRKKLQRLADSLYQRILKGDNFGKLATSFSDDYVSAAADGNIPDISVGQYDPSFEKMVWAMKDNTVGKPFATSFGYHIVKKISSKPVISNPADKTNLLAIKELVKGDERAKSARDFIYETVKTKAGYTKANYEDAILWALSDSLLDYKPAGVGRQMNTESPLFTLGDTVMKVVDFINYAQGNRYRSDRSGIKAYPDLLEEFRKQMMYQYYRDNLEKLNTEFNEEMTEFRDGNLFFEIMQQEVWNKAQSDSLALLSLFEKNKQQYYWKQSSSAVVFFCPDIATAKSLSDKLKRDPKSWRKAIEPFAQTIADSARYEWSQIPGIGKVSPKEKTFTAISVNPTDKSASFAYIVKNYFKSEPRSFADAKGLVMNDYQVHLEEEWIAALREKYKVEIKEEVLVQILK